MKFSIIIRCKHFLNQEMCGSCTPTTDDDTEIILINHHPPHKTAMDYLQNLHHPLVVVLDRKKYWKFWRS